MTDTQVRTEQTDNGQTDVDVNALVQVDRRLRDKVAIVGFADGHRGEAPTDTEQYELWGLNRLHAVLDRDWTRYYEIHDLAKFYTADNQHREWMKAAEFPIYVRPQDMAVAKEWGVTAAEPYPVDPVLGTFGRYFTNSISWMLAHAVLLGFPVLELYGVDMAQDSLTQAEYRQQRPSCEFLLGWVAGAGTQVILPTGSDLLKATHLYGMEDDTIQRARLEARLHELGGRKEAMKQEMASIEGRSKDLFAGINQLDGAMQQATYELTQWMGEPTG